MQLLANTIKRTNKIFTTVHFNALYKADLHCMYTTFGTDNRKAMPMCLVGACCNTQQKSSKITLKEAHLSEKIKMIDHISKHLIA